MHNDLRLGANLQWGRGSPLLHGTRIADFSRDADQTDLSRDADQTDLSRDADRADRHGTRTKPIKPIDD
jgi:hypothetical protein